MPSQLPILVSSSQHGVRPSYKFVPDFWGDQFLNYEPENSEEHLAEVNEAQKLKEEVTNMLVCGRNDSFNQLKLIDDIQRLGVSHHFEGEIEEALENIYATYLDCRSNNEFTDLNHVSLCFRLLRQQGINISSDVFEKFKEEKGMFKESLATDVEGLLSLYEAAYLGVRGETVLDEALLFSRTHLEASLKDGSDTLSKMIAKALNRPLRKSLVRVNAAQFIPIYKNLPSHNETLLRFAILDCNHLQSIHKEQLCRLRKWWRDIEFGKKFPFARDRMVEIFFWVTSIVYEPQFDLSVRLATKLMWLLSIMDDIYDSYATFQELSLFNPTLERWSRESVNNLPNYMKTYNQLLLDCIEDAEESMIKQDTLYRMFYVKDAVKKQSQAYFEEAKWYNEKHTPAMGEYLSVSLISCGHAYTSTMCFAGMSADDATAKDFEWLFNRPKILQASEVINRLMDDLVSDERERETGQTATGKECYAIEYGTTEEEAVRVFRDQVEEAWKDINQEFLKPTAVKTSLLSRLLYLARFMDEFYKDEDGYTVVSKPVKDAMSALFITPLSL